jgi:glycerol-3-phosphate dehydrogenase
MIGGKLASYRLFAEEMSTLIAKELAPSTRCTTHTSPLPGGDRALDARALGADLGVTPVAARRLVYRQGSRAARVAERVRRSPRERVVVCACEPVIEAEVRHAVKEEMAETIEDVARRTRLGLGACGGMRCAARCAQILAEELGHSPREALGGARRFLTRQAKMRVVALGPAQARQEALALAELSASLGTKDRG